MNLLIYVLILFLVFGAIFYVLRYIPLDPPFNVIAQVVVGVIFIIMLLSVVFGIGPVGYWRLQ